MAMEKLWIFVWKNSEHILECMQLSFVLKTVYFIVVHFTIYNTKRNPPKKL